MLGEGFRESSVDCGPYTLVASILHLRKRGEGIQEDGSGAI
jgi:hypothetical protein